MPQNQPSILDLASHSHWKGAIWLKLWTTIFVIGDALGPYSQEWEPGVYLSSGNARTGLGDLLSGSLQYGGVHFNTANSRATGFRSGAAFTCPVEPILEGYNVEGYSMGGNLGGYN